MDIVISTDTNVWIDFSHVRSAREHESGTVFLAKWNDCRSS